MCRCWWKIRHFLLWCNEATQSERVKQRSGLSEDEIRRIIASQATRRERLLHADDVIKNDGSLNELAEKIQRLHRYYTHTLKAV